MGLTILFVIMGIGMIVLLVLLFKNVNELKMDDEVEEMMLRNAARRVLGYMKDYDRATTKDISAMAEEVRTRADELHERGGTENKGDFDDKLIDYMLRNHMIRGEVDEKGEAVFHLTEKSKEEMNRGLRKKKKEK